MKTIDLHYFIICVVLKRNWDDRLMNSSQKFPDEAENGISDCLVLIMRPCLANIS